MNFKVRNLFLDRTEAEIREEMASALGRIGKKLESAIHDLQDIESRVKACPESEKANLVQKYKTARAQAHQYYWYLVIQRESIGLTNHDLLSSIYHIS